LVHSHTRLTRVGAESASWVRLVDPGHSHAHARAGLAITPRSASAASAAAPAVRTQAQPQATAAASPAPLDAVPNVPRPVTAQGDDTNRADDGTGRPADPTADGH